ncbi:hypothetical protein [Fusobacterium sp. HC1336]|uniref:hypothetical protein n=1 Tax=Fusobacterium sp. HC1336 TaxID=3171169 RepID=UPI003F23D976
MEKFSEKFIKLLNEVYEEEKKKEVAKEVEKLSLEKESLAAENSALKVEVKEVFKEKGKLTKELENLTKRFEIKYSSKDEQLKEMKEIGYNQGYEKAENKYLLYKDTLKRIRKNTNYLELILKLVYYINDKNITLEVQDYLDSLFIILTSDEKEKIENFIGTLYKKDEFIDEIIEDMKKLDGASLFKIGEILSELATFSKLPISSSQVSRFKKAMECYDIVRKL